MLLAHKNHTFHFNEITFPRHCCVNMHLWLTAHSYNFFTDKLCHLVNIQVKQLHALVNASLKYGSCNLFSDQSMYCNTMIVYVQFYLPACENIIKFLIMTAEVHKIFYLSNKPNRLNYQEPPSKQLLQPTDAAKMVVSRTALLSGLAKTSPYLMALHAPCNPGWAECVWIKFERWTAECQMGLHAQFFTIWKQSLTVRSFSL